MKQNCKILKLILCSLIAVICCSLTASAQSTRLTVALPYVPEFSDLPKLHDPVSRIIFSNLSYGLTSIALNGESKLELASELNAINGGKIWKIKVRNDSSFPDGRELKLIDVQQTLEHVRQSSLNGTFKISSLKINNERDPYRMRGTAAGELIVELSEANPRFDRLLSTLPILNSETAKTAGDNFGKSTIFSAIGPYVLREARSETGFLLEGVPDFFDPHRPQMPELLFQRYIGAKEALSALRVGAVDLIPLPTREQLKVAADDPTLQIIPSPLIQMAQVSGLWDLSHLYWSNPSDVSDSLNTDKVIVRKSLQLDSRVLGRFDLSGVYYPHN